MQDPNPLPWGAQDRFQAHFIVKREFGEKVLISLQEPDLKPQVTLVQKNNWCNMGRRKTSRRSKH